MIMFLIFYVIVIVLVAIAYKKNWFGFNVPKGEIVIVDDVSMLAIGDTIEVNEERWIIAIDSENNSITLNERE